MTPLRFTADASLYATNRSYRATRACTPGGWGVAVMAQRTTGMVMGRSAGSVMKVGQTPGIQAGASSSMPFAPPDYLTDPAMAPDCAHILWAALTSPRIIQAPAPPAPTPVVATNMCNANNTAVVAPDGRTYDCVPYGCWAGECLRSCHNVDDCQSGYVCDGGVCRPA